MQPLPVWTIGHSNHSLATFVDLLRTHDIEFVVDVRSYPYSRYAPHFSLPQLEAALRAEGVGYLFLGQELGGRPSVDEHYDDDGHALYEPMSREPGFAAGIERVLSGARRYCIALVCSEGDPEECHRRLLVGRVLADRGVELRHILADGSVRVEQDIPVGVGTQEALFDEGPTAWRSTRSVSHRRRHSGSSAA
jgi:uncharacterized protein (DUF488 family)